MRHNREKFSIALLPALGPAGHPFGDGLTAGQWMTGSVQELRGFVLPEAPPQAQHM
jgi:hypothetical protein